MEGAGRMSSKNLAGATLLAAAGLCTLFSLGCRGGPQAVGLILGDPTGLSYRQETSGGEAIAAAVDLAHIGEGLSLHVDWIRHEPSLRSGALEFYWGLGGDLSIRGGPGSDVGLAFRIPLGLDIEFERRVAHLFLQLVPKVPLPNLDVKLDAAIGLRFAF